MGYFRFAFSSDVCFLIGAFLQTYTAVADWNEAEQNASKADDDWDDDGFDPSDALYYALYTLGPLFYLLNALVEIHRVVASLRLKGRSRASIVDGCSERREDDMQPPGDTTPLLAAMASDTKDAMSDTADTSFEDSDEVGSLAASSSSSASTKTTETELRWELAAAVLFGVGALLETYSTVLDDVYDTDDDDSTSGDLVLPWILTYGVINVISMHLYLLCGFVDLYSDRHALKWSTFRNFCTTEGAYDAYVFVGILCFVSGTLLDCTMSFLYEIEIVTNEVTLAKCDVASALLWNICAPLYLMADFILLHDSYGDDDKNLYHSICTLLCSWCGRFWCCCTGRESLDMIPEAAGIERPQQSIFFESMPFINRGRSRSLQWQDLS